MSDQELEEQLRDAGTRLVEPPSSAEDLLPILDEIESGLTRVEQSPDKTMQDALSPAMKALVANELLKHPDTDVKVAVASCVSEITRITAPDAPYNDDQMKEIFQLIVAAFENLYDTSSRSYLKRVSILETVAKVRSCVVMLDLECDGLILEMFQHFLKAIRDFHPENVFKSMETIMSLVLEESEEISSDLLAPLLTSVKRENQDVLPIARKLGEKVLESCTTKLKPCLMQALKSLGTSPNEYSKIVASICQVPFDTVEHNDDAASGENLAEEGTSQEKISSDKQSEVAEEMEPAMSGPEEVDPAVDQSAKNAMSNGDAHTMDIGSLEGIDSPKKKPEISGPTVQPADAEPDSLDSNTAPTEIKSDQPSKRKRGRKPNTADASGRSQIDGDKETSDVLDQTKDLEKEADNSPTEDETLPQIPSPSAPHEESVKVATLPPGQNFPDGARSKKGRLARAKKGTANEDTDRDSRAALNEPEVPSSTDAISKKEPVESSEAKPPKHSGKKTPSVKGNEEGVAQTKDAGTTSDAETKPSKRSAKKANVKNGQEDDVAPTKDVGVTSDSEAKQLKRSGKKLNLKNGNGDDAAPTKDAGVTSDSEAKPLKRSGKKVTVKDGNEGDVAPTKDAGANSDSEAKPLKRSGKKVTVKDGNEDDVAPTKDAGATSDSETKPLKRSGKKVKDGNEDESSKNKQGGKGKKGKGTPITKGDVPGESSNKKISSSSKSIVKATLKNQKNLEETPKATPKTAPKRKRTAGKDEPVETPTSVDECGANIVGSSIKVWWPDDKMFYEGVVESFDPVKKKHKVSYVDGDEEVLMLKDECWEFVDTTTREGEQATDPLNPSAADSPQKKKAKTPSNSGKQTKADTSSKRSKGASSSKAKDEETKSGVKLKDDKVDAKTPKAAGVGKSKNDSVGKSKGETPKTSGKLKVEAPKTGSKSKDETPKTGSKLKEETTPKTGSKSKGGTRSKDDAPKTGSKSNKDGSPKTVGKLKDEIAESESEEDDTPKTATKTSKSGKRSKTNGSSGKGKAEESEEDVVVGKGKLSGTKKKAVESEVKSDNKRKRKGK